MKFMINGALTIGTLDGANVEMRYDDLFLVLADYASYVSCQEQVSAAWQDEEAWTKGPS